MLANSIHMMNLNSLFHHYYDTAVAGNAASGLRVEAIEDTEELQAGQITHLSSSSSATKKGLLPKRDLSWSL